MSILGIILLMGGAVFGFLGNRLNNNIEEQIKSWYLNGSSNPGDIYIIFGIIAAVIGIILIVNSLINRKDAEASVDVSNKRDVFKKVDGYYHCKKCGNRQVLTNGGKCLNCKEELTKN